ncbi:hypothetical protein V492_04815 [Pseudogymnoascus sp. VKM F-4246]|nr:hypothetical protein V492_04815 [Pseudogymnoascus sp. VKM F-4246]
MKFSAPLLLTFAGALTQAQAGPVSFAGDTGVLISVGPVTLGGPDVTLTGTAKSIYEQILVLNPDYNPVDFGGKPIGSEASSTLAKKAHDSLLELTKRTSTGGCCNCNVPPYNVMQDFREFEEGWDYLVALGSRGCGTGSSGVSRVSCSNNAAIWMVSTSQRATSSTCGHLGNLAKAVFFQRCTGGTDVTGQECDTGGFCILLGKASC